MLIGRLGKGEKMGLRAGRVKAVANAKWVASGRHPGDQHMQDVFVERRLGVVGPARLEEEHKRAYQIAKRMRRRYEGRPERWFGGGLYSALVKLFSL